MFWDEEGKCFVDNFGVPLRLSVVRQILANAQIHLQQHPAHLANVANKALDNLPSRPNGMWFVPEDLE